MNTLLLYLLLSQAPARALPNDRARVPRAGQSGPNGDATDLLLRDIVNSGRVLALVPLLDDQVRIAPGAPPLLAFRYLEGRQRGRFGGLDLVLDDAGH
jgi:hypothetical protein